MSLPGFGGGGNAPRGAGGILLPQQVIDETLKRLAMTGFLQADGFYANMPRSEVLPVLRFGSIAYPGGGGLPVLTETVPSQVAFVLTNAMLMAVTDPAGAGQYTIVSNDLAIWGYDQWVVDVGQTGLGQISVQSATNSSLGGIPVLNQDIQSLMGMTQYARVAIGPTSVVLRTLPTSFAAAAAPNYLAGFIAGFRIPAAAIERVLSGPPVRGRL